MKKTPLYETHVRMGGKVVEFAGWALPVQYSGIIEEHKAVRNSAGIFDVSHMGEITVKGPDAERFIQKLVTNDISDAKKHQIIYSPMCYPHGGVVDDLLIYKMDCNDYLLVVNASNTQKDFQWIEDNLEGNVEIENVSPSYAQLALQGPKAALILQKVVNIPLDELKFFHFIPKVDISGVDALVSRTGYTGEDGFEIYISPENATKLWDMLLEAGCDEGLMPAGLGARDTLRFEAALPLYGHEISEEISPLEAGLGRFVKLDKNCFIGREELAKQKAKGLGRKLAGFEMIDRGIPRSHYDITVDGASIGFVTSGSFSPTLEKNIGLALVQTEYSAEGTVLDIAIRNRLLKAKVVKTPFYSRKRKK